MKLKIPMLLLIIFISGCTTIQEPSIIRPKQVETTTTISEITITIKEFECEEKLTRKHYYEDKTFDLLCLKPEQLGLKRCQTNEDCTDIEKCKKGFCELVYSLVIDETIS